MKRLFSILAAIVITFAIAQSPGPGYTLVNANCSSVNLGIVTITSGELTYLNPETGDVIHKDCSAGDRWHWFWE